MSVVPEPHIGWTFLTNHARVLTAIADDRHARMRDLAAYCRITERAVQKIISDLEKEGYLSHQKEGRTNVYRIESETVLRHPAEAGLSVASLLSLIVKDEVQRSSQSGEPIESAPQQAGSKTELPSEDLTR